MAIRVHRKSSNKAVRAIALLPVEESTIEAVNQVTEGLDALSACLLYASGNTEGIELDNETNDRLTALSEQLGLSKAELIRAGVALLEIGIQAKQEGFKFGVVTKDQPLVSEVVGL